MHTLAHTTPTPARRPAFRPLAWLVALDAAWREKRAFDRLDARARDDIGLGRAAKDAEFYGRFRMRDLG